MNEKILKQKLPPGKYINWMNGCDDDDSHESREFRIHDDVEW